MSPFGIPDRDPGPASLLDEAEGIAEHTDRPRGGVVHVARAHGGVADLPPAVGAVAGVVLAAGPLLPIENARFVDNLRSPDVLTDLPTVYLGGRLVQLGLIVLCVVVGLLMVRAYGLGVAAGGVSVSVWMWLSALLELSPEGPGPVGIAHRNAGATDSSPHAVTSVGVVLTVAMLLIAAVLQPDQLQEFDGLATDLGLDVLVEVHDERELENALATQATLVGVNNRDLHTFTTDLTTSERLRPLVPEQRTMVTESGIHTVQDVSRMKRSGINAFLVGEAFMRSQDPGAALKALFFAGEVE